MMSEIDTGMHYPIKLDELPPSWVIAFVGDFCDGIQSGFACGRHSDSNIGVPHLRPMNISRNGELDFEVIKYVASDFDGRRLSENDVLFNNTNSPELIGKTAYVTQKGHGLAFSNHMTRLKFHRDVNSKFGAYQLHYLWMARYFLHGCVKHVNQASVSATELARSVPFVVSPIKEQHRIVTKIEELFSELDKGIEYLKTAQAQLKVYRQALLKHAFEGKLTAQWRKQQRAKQSVAPAKAGAQPLNDMDSRLPPTFARMTGNDEVGGGNDKPLETAADLLKRIQQERVQRYQQQLADWEASGKQGSKPKPPKSLPPLTAEELAELPELPEGWGWVKSGELFESVTSGSRGWAQYYADSGAIFIRITNLDFDSLKLDLSPKKIQYVQPPVGTEGLRTKVKEGDFLFSITGYLGMFAIAPSIGDAYVNQHISLARPLDGCSKKYFGYYVTSHTGGIHYLNKQTKGAVKAGLGLDDIQNFPVPICSLNEQIQISSELESRLSEIDQLDQTITTALQQAEALRQSILKKAFSGQLVPQDPNDEPASELLARIKADRLASQGNVIVRRKGERS